MRVRVQSKYSLREEDLNLLPGNKVRWWMKSEDREGKEAFVPISRDAVGSDPLDEVIDIPPGRYSAGCGEWNVENSQGRRVYQRLYFYVTTDGGVVYVDRKDQLPQLDEIMDGKVSGGVKPQHIDEFTDAPKEVVPTYTPIELVRYCVEKTSDLSEVDRIVDANSVCDLFVEDFPGMGAECSNCLYGHKLFLKG